MTTKIKTAFILMLVMAMLLIVTCGTFCVFAEESEAETVVESGITTEEVTEDFIEDVDEPEADPTEDIDESETEPTEDIDEPEAEPTEEVDESETEPTEDIDEPEAEPTEDDETTIEEVAASFVEYLKATFGEDYTSYYNAIIDSWGTVEEYLLSFGESVLPEQYQTGWQEFVSWLSEYSPVWAPVLAIIIVVFVYIIGKRRFKKIVQEAVDTKIEAVGDELNKQDKATTAILHSVSALLGTNKKFADNVKELEESEKELNS